MTKAHLDFLSFGFLLILVFSEIRYACSAGDTCMGRSDIQVTNCKTGCGATCSEHNFEGPSQCMETTTPLGYTNYECKCCKCEVKISLDTNSCNNPHNCVEACVLSGYNGPSECRELYVGSDKYVHKCYCCDEKKNFTAGNYVAIA